MSGKSIYDVKVNRTLYIHNFVTPCPIVTINFVTS